MRISIISIPVLDQEKAKQFYTEKCGFIVKRDDDLGNGNKWLTLVSPDAPDGTELLLEPAPLHFEPSKVYQEAIMAAGMPYTQFEVDSVQAEYDRMVALGVEFTVQPTKTPMAMYAAFKDTCGNIIAIVEPLSPA